MRKLRLRQQESRRVQDYTTGKWVSWEVAHRRSDSHISFLLKIPKALCFQASRPSLNLSFPTIYFEVLGLGSKAPSSEHSSPGGEGAHKPNPTRPPPPKPPPRPFPSRSPVRQSRPRVLGGVKGWKGEAEPPDEGSAESGVLQPLAAPGGGVRGGAAEARPASGWVEIQERPGPGERLGREGEV